MVVFGMLLTITALLLAIVIMLLTGWPTGRKKELETIGRELRRELAGHRADSVQALHAMKVELGDAVRQTGEESFSSMRFSFSGSSGSRGKGYRRDSKKQALSSDVPGDDRVEGESSLLSGAGRESEDDRQLSLFAKGESNAVTAQDGEYMVCPEDFDDLDNL